MSAAKPDPHTPLTSQGSICHFLFSPLPYNAEPIGGGIREVWELCKPQTHSIRGYAKKNGQVK